VAFLWRRRGEEVWRALSARERREERRGEKGRERERRGEKRIGESLFDTEEGFGKFGGEDSQRSSVSVGWFVGGKEEQLRKKGDSYIGIGVDNSRRISIVMSTGH
jgi:hypothetical protein